MKSFGRLIVLLVFLLVVSCAPIERSYEYEGIAVWKNSWNEFSSEAVYVVACENCDVVITSEVECVSDSNSIDQTGIGQSAVIVDEGTQDTRFMPKIVKNGVVEAGWEFSFTEGAGEYQVYAGGSEDCPNEVTMVLSMHEGGTVTMISASSH